MSCQSNAAIPESTALLPGTTLLLPSNPRGISARPAQLLNHSGRLGGFQVQGETCMREKLRNDH